MLQSHRGIGSVFAEEGGGSGAGKGEGVEHSYRKVVAYRPSAPFCQRDSTLGFSQRVGKIVYRVALDFVHSTASTQIFVEARISVCP